MGFLWVVVLVVGQLWFCWCCVFGLGGMLVVLGIGVWWCIDLVLCGGGSFVVLSFSVWCQCWCDRLLSIFQDFRLWFLRWCSSIVCMLWCRLVRFFVLGRWLVFSVSSVLLVVVLCCWLVFWLLSRWCGLLFGLSLQWVVGLSGLLLLLWFRLNFILSVFSRFCLKWCRVYVRGLLLCSCWCIMVQVLYRLGSGFWWGVSCSSSLLMQKLVSIVLFSSCGVVLSVLVL